jgi:hypothetical protein
MDRTSQGDFYPQVSQALLADPDFYPHFQVRLLAQNWPIFIRIDLRHLAKIWEILSAKKSGILGYFQGSWRGPRSEQRIIFETETSIRKLMMP